ncbi:hypothetical protein [Sorangium sp. So ce1151]|uniref:hypothetical protein n=1 Tax=Sorangium sp. So ce1151 TaxID=3133332 RepID=UPI003F62016B
MRSHIRLLHVFSAALFWSSISASSYAQTAVVSRSSAASTPALAPHGPTPSVPVSADAPSPREDRRTSDELAMLYGNAVAWGVGSGVAVGIVSESGKPAAFVLPAIGMSALGAGAVALLDSTGEPLRRGVPGAIAAGLSTGLSAGVYASFIAHGVSAHRGASAEDTSDTGVFDVFDEGSRLSAGATAGIVWGASTAGALTGGLLGHTLRTTPGRASFIQSGAEWGGLIPFAIMAGSLSGSSSFDAPERAILAGTAGLVGMTAGAVTTGLLGRRVSPSTARVRYIDLGGLGGGLLAGGIYASAARDIQPRPFFLLSALGAGVGLGIGAIATRNMAPDLPRRDRKANEAWVRPTFAPVEGGATAGVAGVF